MSGPKSGPKGSPKGIFDATLNQLCAGTTSLEAALAAFNREQPDNRDALLCFRMIEAAWQTGKLDRKSYDALRRAALDRSAGLAAESQQPDAMNEPMISARSHWADHEREADDASLEVRAERRTRVHSRTDEPRHRAANASAAESPAESPHSNPRVPDSGHLSRPSPGEHEAAPPLGPQSVLKERFVLEQIIGRGGMGTIFRARDLRKEEAQDRYPYVAVKVLNEDFRRHPESLIALQREARKAQTLAHPNIATVYDFDRDGPVVFLVMELLEGVSLNEFIKSRVGRPLPQAEARRIVQALGAALAHAHQNGLVHADFKPANAFRTHDGTVKVLDFGIARAIGRRTLDREHTVFDPARLGALTPCYASPEMLVGDVPDPRDDVYGLACVAYELFGCRHPFDFVSSQLAERRGLKPAPIPGLDRRTWRALQHGLKFSRESRAPSVEAFLAEMAPARPVRGAAMAATLAAIVLGVVSWKLVPEYLNDWTQARYTTELQSRDPVTIDALLPRLFDLPAPQRDALFDDPAAREALIDHMEGKIRSATQMTDDPASEHVSYEQALRYVDQLDRLLPDVSRSAALRADIAASRRQALATSVVALNQQLTRGWLTDAQSPENALRTMAKLRQIDSQWQPDRTVLNRAFLAQIRQALYDRKDVAAAAALAAAGKEVGVAGAEFEQLEAAITQQRTASMETPLPEASRPASPPAPAPATVMAHESAAGPGSATSVAPAPLPPPAVSAATESVLTLEQRQQRLLALAAADDLTEALELLRGLQSALPADDPFLAAEAPNALAETYIRLSDRAFDNGQFESAAALLTRAAEFNPRAPEIAERRESVDRVAHVAHTLEFVIGFSADRVIAELEHIEVSEGERFPLIRTQLAEILAQRITEAQSTAPQRANELLQAARLIFPGSPVFANLLASESTFGAGP